MSLDDEDRCLVPLGAVQVVPRPRGTELRNIKNVLRRVDKYCGDANIPKRRSLHAASTEKSTPELAKPQPELRLFGEPDALSNMVLVVEGTDLHVHKEVLAGWSPVFMAMFSSQFMETEQNRVIMTGKQVKDVRLLLNCIYPPNIHQVTADNMMSLLPLIEEYDISALKTKCEDILLQQEPSLDILYIAHEYNMTQVIQRTISACGELPLSSIDHRANHELANHIPQHYILDIYRKKIEQQAEKLRIYKRLKGRSDSLYQKLESWGKAINSYPCEKHRVFNDECVPCLKGFQTYALELAKNLPD